MNCSYKFSFNALTNEMLTVGGCVMNIPTNSVYDTGQASVIHNYGEILRLWHRN